MYLHRKECARVRNLYILSSREFQQVELAAVFGYRSILHVLVKIDIEIIPTLDPTL